MTSHIGSRPTREMYESGKEIDCQCARCGSSCEWVDCWNGCEEGYLNNHDLDPLWYHDEYDQPCDVCECRGGWHVCISGDEWCQAHPLTGREAVNRGEIEWFTCGE